MSDRVPRPKDFKYGRDLAPPEKRLCTCPLSDPAACLRLRLTCKIYFEPDEPEEERERCQCPCHYEQPGDFDDV